MRMRMSFKFCNTVLTDFHGGMLNAYLILHFNNMLSKSMLTFTHLHIYTLTQLREKLLQKTYTPI